MAVAKANDESESKFADLSSVGDVKDEYEILKQEAFRIIEGEKYLQQTNLIDFEKNLEKSNSLKPKGISDLPDDHDGQEEKKEKVIVVNDGTVIVDKWDKKQDKKDKGEKKAQDGEKKDDGRIKTRSDKHNPQFVRYYR